MWALFSLHQLVPRVVAVESDRDRDIDCKHRTLAIFLEPLEACVLYTSTTLGPLSGSQTIPQ